ncbi:hypothetical protein GGR01_002887, partial [Acetobacter oeni]|nr:hypothetical protein [Acetobacter oeni]
MRYRSNVTPSTTEAAVDMRNLVKRGQGYYARLIIPQDRWQDAGKVMGCRSGIRREVVRTLGTRDHREAIRRREKMLETMRAELDAKLMQAGLLPLHGEWCPTVTQSVLEAWSPSSPRGKASPDEQAVVDGLAYRQDLQAASGEYIVRDNPYQSHDGLPDTERERLTDVVREKVQDKAEAMPPAAGGRYYRAAMGIIEGTLTPLGGLLDRWDKDRERMISKASRAMDQA